MSKISPKMDAPGIQNTVFWEKDVFWIKSFDGLRSKIMKPFIFSGEENQYVNMSSAQIVFYGINFFRSVKH